MRRIRRPRMTLFRPLQRLLREFETSFHHNKVQERHTSLDWKKFEQLGVEGVGGTDFKCGGWTLGETPSSAPRMRRVWRSDRASTRLNQSRTLGPTGWTERSEGSPWQSVQANKRERQSGRWGQRSAASLASEGRGKASTPRSDDRQSGRWEVVPASEHQDIFVAVASLIGVPWLFFGPKNRSVARRGPRRVDSWKQRRRRVLRTWGLQPLATTSSPSAS
jgi:hypothetical protein